MFAFYVVLRGNKKLEKLLMLEISKRSVLGVLIRKSGPLESAPLANQIQGFRIPDRYEAGEQNKRRDNIVV